MLSVLEDPAIRARAHAISVADYHTMIERGAIGENLELLRGVLVEKTSKSSLHSRLVLWLLRWFTQHLPAGYSVRPEQPLTLSDSEPEPDLAVVAGDIDDFAAAHSTAAELVVEICVSSEAIDRLKLQLYAEAGVRECWLVLAEERVLERHTGPQGTVYQNIERVTFPGTLASTVFPGLALPPAGLFPA
ncbi:MAG: Uma2 family endonuclease [Chthoniobacteraceae bacterium]